jgi:aspartate kinase
MFGVLAGLGININMINTSEMKISVVVDQEQANQAVAALKEVFQLA